MVLVLGPGLGLVACFTGSDSGFRLVPGLTSSPATTGPDPRLVPVACFIPGLGIGLGPDPSPRLNSGTSSKVPGPRIVSCLSLCPRLILEPSLDFLLVLVVILVLFLVLVLVFVLFLVLVFILVLVLDLILILKMVQVFGPGTGPTLSLDPGPGLGPGP